MLPKRFEVLVASGGTVNKMPSKWRLVHTHHQAGAEPGIEIGGKEKIFFFARFTIFSIHDL